MPEPTHFQALITGELPDRTDDRLLAPAFNESLTKSRELFKNCKFVLSCSGRNSQKGRPTAPSTGIFKTKNCIYRSNDVQQRQDATDH